MLILILPTLVIVIWVFSRDSSQNESNQINSGLHQNGTEVQDSPDTYDPSIENNPAHGANSDASAPGTSPETNIPDTSNSETHDPSLSGPLTYDSTNGIIKFLFTPDNQTELDDNTITMIGMLLTSQQDTEDKKIAVEIPQVSDTETAVITTAIINALEVYDIPVSDIVFLIYQPEPDIQTFEINISFYQ